MRSPRTRDTAVLYGVGDSDDAIALTENDDLDFQILARAESNLSQDHVRKAFQPVGYLDLVWTLVL